MNNTVKTGNKTISIYLPDRAVYDNLAEDVARLWYSNTGHTMTKGETIIKSLLIAKQYLSGIVDTVSNKESINIKKVGRL